MTQVSVATVLDLVDGWFVERVVTREGCGLFFDDVNDTSAPISKSLPLKSRVVTATIDCDLGIAETVEIHTYQSSKACSATFKFPLPPKAAVHRFEATVGDKVIRTQTKKKARAELEFQTAVQQGHTAVIAKQTSTDIYSIDLGNLPANQVCEIKIGYLRLLDKVSNTIQYLHTATWVPPYQGGPSNYGQETPADVVAATPAYTDKVSYQLSYEIRCVSQAAIRSVTCADPAIIVDGPHGKIVNLEVEVADAGKDFELVVELESTVLASRLQRQVCHRGGEGKTVLLATFVPRLPSELAVPVPLREVWLVVDCSGSMMGTPIRQAQEAALFFIKDMPLDAGVRFNVVAFGSDYKFMYPEARLYSETTNAEAVKWVTNGNLGNLGGTEIYKCLKAIDGVKVPQGYTRQIIFLTDGGVSGDEERNILSLFKKPVAPRVFSLGIGHGVHRGLLVDLAEASSGVTQFAAEDAGILRSCNALKKCAMAPALLHKARLTCRNAIMHLVPAVLPSVLFPDQPVTVLAEVAAEQEGAALELSAQVAGSGVGWKAELVLNSAELAEGDMLPVLHAMGYVNALLAGSSSLHLGPDGTPRRPAPRQDLVEEEVVRVAVAENLVTPLTASVGVMLQANPLDPAKVEHVDVPIQVPHGRALWGTSPAAVELQGGGWVPNRRASGGGIVLQSGLISMAASASPSYQSASFARAPAGASASLRDVSDIMACNIEKVLARGERLEELQCKSGELQMAAGRFQKSAAGIRPMGALGGMASGISSALGAVASGFSAIGRSMSSSRNTLHTSSMGPEGASKESSAPAAGAPPPGQAAAPAAPAAPAAILKEQDVRLDAEMDDGAFDFHAEEEEAEGEEGAPAVPAAAPKPAQVAAPPQAPVLPPKEVLRQLNGLRNAEGFWQASPALLAMLAPSDASQAAIQSARPQDVPEDEWSTLVVLAYLRKHLAGEQAVWEGMAEKAQQWLQARWPATARSVAATIIAIMKEL